LHVSHSLGFFLIDAPIHVVLDAHLKQGDLIAVHRVAGRPAILIDVGRQLINHCWLD
jgi:hypothetical protein